MYRLLPFGNPPASVFLLLRLPGKGALTHTTFLADTYFLCLDPGIFSLFAFCVLRCGSISLEMCHLLILKHLPLPLILNMWYHNVDSLG